MVFLASDYSSYLTGEVDLREQPTCLRHPRAPRPGAPRARRAARHRGEAVRRARVQEHDGARHRRRRRHPVRQPLPPLRLQGGDGRRAARLLPARAVGGVRRHRGLRPHSAGEAERRRPCLLRRDRPQPQRGRDLPDRRGLPRDLRPVRLPRTSATPASATSGPACSRDGVAAGELRADLDVELVYRFLRDTVWVAVRWYRPGGDLSPAPGRRPVPPHPARRDPASDMPRPTSSTPSARRSASAAARSPRCTPPTSAPTCSRRSSSAPASTPAPSTTW